MSNNANRHTKSFIRIDLAFGLNRVPEMKSRKDARESRRPEAVGELREQKNDNEGTEQILASLVRSFWSWLDHVV
jgi:hypothetical protein